MLLILLLWCVLALQVTAAAAANVSQRWNATIPICSGAGLLSLLVADADGTIARCHLRDPSSFQWPLLEAAIEGKIVADFPVCNKSLNCFNSGHDLLGQKMRTPFLQRLLHRPLTGSAPCVDDIAPIRHAAEPDLRARQHLSRILPIRALDADLATTANWKCML